MKIEEAKKRAEELLQDMKPGEKMGQLVGYYPRQWSPEELEKMHPHGVGQVACFEMRNILNIEELSAYQRSIQEKVMELSEHHIPAIFHLEGLCGVLLSEGDCFPSGIGRGASFDPKLEQKIGEIVGKQSRAVGASQILAPVLDISRDSRFGRQGETYGEDPALASALGCAYVKGIQQERQGMLVESTAKHFLGYHNAQGGIHAAECQTPGRLLREIYGKPFQAAITESGLRGVMPCYGTFDGEPASASAGLLQGILRQEMGFDGLVVSDYCSISEIHDRQNMCESVTDAGLRALEAGVDMELPSAVSYNKEMERLFEEGKADMELLDRAVLHILTEKFRMGLFENPFALTGSELEKSFYQKEDAEMCLCSARESLVLLQNDGTLPLENKIGKMAVIGYHAKAVRALFGGYTHMSMTERWLGAANTMAGMSMEKGAADSVQRYPGTYVQREHPDAEKLAKKLKPRCNNLWEELQQQMPETEFTYAFGYPYAGTEEDGFEEALQAAADAEVILLTLGGKYGTGSMASTGEGIDSVSINLPPCQERFLERLSEEKKAGRITAPVIAVHFDGRPVSSDMASQVCSAILEAWNPGDWGAKAIVETLRGFYNPAGRLPVTVAHTAGQEPIYYNHPNGSSYHQGTIGAFHGYMNMEYEPRYYFGHGLSYTDFQYSDLKIVRKDAGAEIHFSVTNTGAYDGEEVVQLYLKDRNASMLRPVMELAGFVRCFISRGETKKISFVVENSQLAFLDRNNQWKIEKGSIEVLIGASGEDIRLRGSYEIMSDCFVDGRSRAFLAEARAEDTE